MTRVSSHFTKSLDGGNTVDTDLNDELEIVHDMRRFVVPLASILDKKDSKIEAASESISLAFIAEVILMRKTSQLKTKIPELGQVLNQFFVFLENGASLSINISNSLLVLFNRKLEVVDERHVYPGTVVVVVVTVAMKVIDVEEVTDRHLWTVYSTAIDKKCQ